MTLKLEIPQIKMECKSVPQNRLPIVKERITTVMDHATPQIATRRDQRDSPKCRRLAMVSYLR